MFTTTLNYSCIGKTATYHHEEVQAYRIYMLGGEVISYTVGKKLHTT